MLTLAALATLACAVSASSSASQVHITQGKTPESMIISWQTAGTSDSVVRYGKDSKSLDRSASGDSKTYTFNWYGFANYVSGYFHHAELTGLEPQTQYYYQIGDSEVLSFKTLPAVGDKTPMSFGVIGDLGQTDDSLSTLQHLIDNTDLKMTVHVGDLSYADCDQTKWDTYGNTMQVLADNRPWMVGAGNHEIEAGPDGKYFTSLETRYRMPSDHPAEFGKVTIAPGHESNGNLYCSSSEFQMEYNYGNSFYSFDAGLVHTIFLNCYSTSDESSVQYKWLEADLQRVDRQKTPWVVVSMHCPWYNSNEYHHDEKQCVAMKSSMEKIFYQYHVNMAFTGHVHAYERTYPVYNNATVSDGVVYVTIGDGGNAEGHAYYYYDPAPSWSAFRNGTQYGHGEVHVYNNTHMMWEWHRNVDNNPIVKDSVVICNSALGYASDCSTTNLLRKEA